MSEIKKILIANRGEIALRIIRTCKERSIQTVAIYSEPDGTAPHVLASDESVCVGGAPSSDSYLASEKIIEAALETGADAIHPGYGFLSENAAFAEKCHEHKLIFIGPSPQSIWWMGDKTRARELMAKANVPCPPGTKSAIREVNKAKEIAKKIGFPVLVKAAAGGGGKGMRIVDREEDFEKSVKAAQSEAKNAFGDDRVYIEKYLEEPRHIEFQILADQTGNTIHLFERECSIQRRHQKVIEEAPSSLLTDHLRREMAQAAIDAALACGYTGAGTVEFLVDKHHQFYFLEMNTRLQVEHPVTELITGLDLVSLQIHIAEGKKLPFKQDDVRRFGHAIECRIYAEDPANQFLPSTGKLRKHRIPSGPGIRVDAGVEEGQEIPIHYDPMISKLCAHAPDRLQAIQKMNRALDEYEISGVKTTIPFCKFAINHSQFREGTYDTHFVNNYFNARPTEEPESFLVTSLAASLLKANSHNHDRGKENISLEADRTSNWWRNRREWERG